MCLFLLPPKINASIKQNFLQFGPENARLIIFSEVGCEWPGGVWDTFLAKWIEENRGDTDGSSISSSNLSDQMSDLKFYRRVGPTVGPRVGPRLGPIVGPRVCPRLAAIQGRAARDLISSIEEQHKLYLYDSKFPLFGFMREVATNEKKHPKLYLWQGEADAIAYSCVLNKYVIIEFKVVDNLSDYWKSKTDLCGKHLHQCLVYAKLLQLHMNLHYLPPSLIVVIHKVTGKEGYFALFKDYPQECYERLDEYEWFTEQPKKRPLRIVNTDNLLHEDFRHGEGVVDPHRKLSDILREDATVKDLLDSLGYDSLLIFRQKQQ